MPLNEQKVLSILLDELKSTEKRCPKYHDVLQDALVEILLDERAHLVAATNIQQKVTDKCRAAGRVLADALAKNE